MASPAQPKAQVQGTHQNSEKEFIEPASEPIYLRHRYHGELGQMLRDYYSNALDEPVPDRLLQLIEQFRHKEQNK
jgi:hypothetical protein